MALDPPVPQSIPLSPSLAAGAPGWRACNLSRQRLRDPDKRCARADAGARSRVAAAGRHPARPPDRPGSGFMASEAKNRFAIENAAPCSTQAACFFQSAAKRMSIRDVFRMKHSFSSKTGQSYANFFTNPIHFSNNVNETARRQLIYCAKSKLNPISK
ncbi:hypothetical protein [Burkholderia glumae]|uniref:Uncharacterized protein n=3 Tax=Burkholderia glumae TaxID=337 RepID=A0AAP9Y4Q5_BURGL|nr:hypothetical protein [Burkholderia glumae]MCM2480803.1 hypothetical protein [Burkholderia glumae]MCM2509058.1 hypothetical protein [Burkholderia glumae]MCM2537523.1 hypothetical protein [Burkholderia glumae]QPQ94040.1 hypothetical protein I6H06_17860 [Burkholderia glumae]QQM90759.1 hypothetical protein I6G78_16785 [Burkholderia glumae]